MNEVDTQTDNEEEPYDRQGRASLIIISDFVCPWCYIGHQEVDRLKEEYDLDIQFAPFLLRPDTPPEGAPVRHYVPADAPPTAMEQRGERLGVKFNRGRELTSNSHLALEAAEFANENAEDPGLFYKRMFQAYFTDLEDISVLDNVVRVGAEAGLDADELRRALVEGRYRERVDEGIEGSRSIGVTAIPTFVFNEQYGMVGAQEIEAFRAMMEKLNQPSKSQS
jgi:predicted DsbA family dithiol-disulfide isomerase